ncbi:MAG TPA: hypothetical protein PLM70_07945 [Bacteroidales bacterium]|nr:hypothetical protein [Candidatus Paceibacterota bacterium]HPS72171.1 hypothetical protein [Bacteroidales bacterium]
MIKETQNRMFQKTQTLNVRISPAFKNELIQKAASMQLNLSEYIEYILSNEQIKENAIQDEKRKNVEFLNQIEKVKNEKQLQDQNRISLINQINEIIENYPEFSFPKIESTNDIMELLTQLFDLISQKDETKNHLQFFTENKQLQGIFYKVKGQEIKYYNGETIESTIPQTIEDLFMILVNDYHAKINLNKK